ncbi:MAG TPA: transglycosylase SLT domain-containing protein [Actinomycetota bacterium]|nr:transglycosylase SLT domain-containing protein [Actinomycetota bacterium]
MPPDPASLTPALVRTDLQLASALRRWTAAGAPSPPPADVALLALFQQRIYGTLAANRSLARAVLAQLPPDLAAAATANVAADRALTSLSGAPPAKAPRLETQDPDPAGELLRDFRQAERRFGVAWQVLAAINLIESRFGRVVSSSSAGAQGPMQFLPATWRAYGMGGNVRDPRDAIMGAANYLRASGAPSSYRRAVFAYNPSTAYVNAVLAYAGRMRRDPLAFYDYYNWQVFQATASGDEQLTGPGT